LIEALWLIVIISAGLSTIPCIFWSFGWLINYSSSAKMKIFSIVSGFGLSSLIISYFWVFCGKLRDKVPKKIFIGLMITKVNSKTIKSSFAFNYVFNQRH